VVEGSTELVDESSEELISHQVLMAEEGDNDGDLPIDELDAVSEDEATANTGDKDDTVVRRGGLGIGLALLAEGGSMSACDPCIANLTPNSLP
jgi:hypothetical protein